MLDEGKDLQDLTKTKIFETLTKLSYRQLTEDRAAIAENINRERGFQPPMFPFMHF